MKQDWGEYILLTASPTCLVVVNVYRADGTKRYLNENTVYFINKILLRLYSKQNLKLVKFQQNFSAFSELIHCSLMTTYGGIDLGQHWLVAWQHQAITWTNVDFSLVRFYGIHMR